MIRIRKILFGLARSALGVGLLYYILFVRDSGLEIGRFLGAGWLFIVLPLIAFIGVLTEAWRLRLLCRSQTACLGIWHGLQLVLVSIFFNFFIPGGTGGDVAKVYYLSTDNPGKGVELAVVVFVDRITGLLGMVLAVMLLALINIPLLVDYPVIMHLVMILALVLVGTVTAGLMVYSGAFRRNRIYRFIRERLPLQHLVGRIAGAVNTFRNHKGALLAAVIISLLGNGVMLSMFMSAGTVFLPDVAGQVVCFLSVLGMFANALPLTPGGLGVGEAAFDGLFGLLGVSGGAIIMLAWRLGMLPIGLAGGLFYISGIGRKSTPEVQTIDQGGRQ